MVGLRDHAIIAVMTYTFARVGAVVALAVEDYYPQKKHWWLKLHEKNGKLNEMPCHPKLAVYLDEYIDAAERVFPSGVFGPVDSWALAMLAMI